MKRMFKSITSLLLTVALLLMPCFSTTTLAAEEGVNEGDISSENINTETEMINTGYSYGNYIEPDDVIPNPDYISSEGNSQIQGATNSTASTMSTTSERLADGIYWINNLHNGKYLDTLNGGVTSGTPVVQWIYSAHINNNENEYNRNQLFKVTCIGTNDGEDYYTIRPMTNNGLGLTAPTDSSSNLVDVQTMPTGETFYDIPWYQKWVIIKDEKADYYTIQNRLVDGNVFLSANRDNVDGTQISLGAGTSSLTPDTPQMWYFHPYNGPSIDGMGMTKFTTGVAKGKYFRYQAFSYSTTIGRNGPPAFSVTDRNGNATDIATITSGSGMLRGIEMGEAQIRTTYSGAPWLWLWNMEVQFENGTYILQNQKNHKYMTSSDASNGVLKGYTFEDSPLERWELIYDSTSGFYKIKNSANSLYLTAPSTTATGANITEQTYSSSIANRQLWRFIKTSAGYYRVQPREYENYNLHLSAINSIIGDVNIKQNAYIDDSNFEDEWFLLDCNKILNLDVVYDHAYSQRYSNANSRITENLKILKEFFLIEFNIFVNYETPELFYSYADINCSANYDELCYHTATCTDTNSSTNHHKNAYQIYYNITPPNKAETLKVAFIGHMTCTQLYHNTSGAYGTKGLGSMYYGLAMIMNFSSQDAETQTFIHEFGHLLGSLDHYAINCPGTSEMEAETGHGGYSEFCIYGEKKDELNNMQICDGCKIDIQNNISQLLTN